jgi:hypothetical protein
LVRLPSGPTTAAGREAHFVGDAQLAGGGNGERLGGGVLPDPVVGVLAADAHPPAAARAAARIRAAEGLDIPSSAVAAAGLLEGNPARLNDARPERIVRKRCRHASPPLSERLPLPETRTRYQARVHDLQPSTVCRHPENVFSNVLRMSS